MAAPTLAVGASLITAFCGPLKERICFHNLFSPRPPRVTSLSRPGGNITGVSTSLVDMEPNDWSELRAQPTTAAILVSPGAIPRAEIQLNDIQTAARSVGQEINVLNASTSRDIDAAFAKLVQVRADALLVATDAFFITRAAQLVVLAARHAIPTVYSRHEYAAAGELMSYGVNLNESYRVVGVYAARILKGGRDAPSAPDFQGMTSRRSERPPPETHASPALHRDRRHWP